MRTELETIAYIEQYLLNVLTDVEIQAFEERMATDPNFKNEVELQEQLIHSLERISLQQTIQNAQKSYVFWKIFKLIGIILISILSIIIAWYFMNASSEMTTESESIPTKVEQQIQEHKKTVTQEVVSDPDTIPKKKTPLVTQNETTVFAEHIVIDPLEKIQSEVFTILTTKDTIVETKSGIVLLIPENTFVDKKQNAVSGTVQLEVKEAIDPAKIMTAGLSTLFNDKPLETGGMFFIEAKKDGQKLQIHPKKEITADIPTQDYKEGMQLFDGEVLEDGTINWTNPKPLNKTLISHDIYSLNFYPPNYLETLAEKGYDTTNKKFTDSLYYSFGNAIDKKEKDSLKIKGVIGRRINRNNRMPIDTVRTDAIIVKRKDSVKSNIPKKKILLGLDPLKVKTIWNERYQNTFIATKAFEERLQVIHKNCADANTIFDIYVQNLNHNLHEVDKMIVSTIGNTSLRKQFETFAAQQLTNVPNIDADVSKLNQYYIQQQKVYRLTLEKTQRTVDSLLKFDTEYQQLSKQRLQEYYSKELEITIDKVTEDLGARLPRSFNQTPTSRTDTVSNKVLTNFVSIANTINKEKRKRRYRAPIRTTGWKNIDRIINEKVISSLKNRTTTTIKTRKKSATISYSDYEVSIENTEHFEQLFVYLVPNEFNSFIRLKSQDKHFTYKLNDILNYHVYCIAYLNDVPYYIDKTIKNASDKLILSKITTEALRKKLSKINSKNTSLETEVSYETFKNKHGTNLKKYRELIKLKRALNSIVFPCKQTEILNDALLGEETELIISDSISFEEDTTIAFEFVETVPIYPGCETFESAMERKKCMSEKIRRVINTKFDTSVMSGIQQLKGTQRIDAVFNIDTSGLVKDIQVRSNHPKLDAEVKRVIQLLPKMKPATQRGRTVIVKYTIPIMFSVH